MKIKNREQCWDIIVETLTDIIEDMGEEPEKIEFSTMLNRDLGLSSVEAIHLMIILEDRSGKPLNFQELAVRDGEYVEDLAIGRILAFVSDSLDLPESPDFFVPAAYA